MSSLLKAFNNHLLEFVEDVIRIFPENLDIKTGKLNQVLVNLFVNAAQAMEDGDKLTISSFEEKDHTVITVKDTGCGIEKHALQKLFEPFYTTKPTGTHQRPSNQPN